MNHNKVKTRQERILSSMLNVLVYYDKTNIKELFNIFEILHIKFYANERYTFMSNAKFNNCFYFYEKDKMFRVKFLSENDYSMNFDSFKQYLDIGMLNNIPDKRQYVLIKNSSDLKYLFNNVNKGIDIFKQKFAFFMLRSGDMLYYCIDNKDFKSYRYMHGTLMRAFCSINMPYTFDEIARNDLEIIEEEE